MTGKRVYIAGAYSANNVLGILDNIRNGLRWSTEIFLAGHAPFSPWADFLFHLQLREGETLTVEQYYEYSLAWLKASDVMFVTPGWENSKGTLREISTAETLGIPVVFSMRELKALSNAMERGQTA